VYTDSINLYNNLLQQLREETLTNPKRSRLMQALQQYLIHFVYLCELLDHYKKLYMKIWLKLEQLKNWKTK
jgi:hypothetical protein